MKRSITASQILTLVLLSMFTLVGCEVAENIVVEAPEDPDAMEIDIDTYEREMAKATNEEDENS